ncbi:hypothetical protein O6H91_Y242400 [Diphasiastrum complanatum]|nr:hypothetical protein O6H91_Y242400 [Diphasiastrum complanatum]
MKLEPLHSFGSFPSRIIMQPPCFGSSRLCCRIFSCYKKYGNSHMEKSHSYFRAPYPLTKSLHKKHASSLYKARKLGSLLTLPDNVLPDESIIKRGSNKPKRRS